MPTAIDKRITVYTTKGKDKLVESYIGTINGWAPNFAPQGWAFCAGQILSIAQNSTVFALLGTTYGGNGVQTFGLPNLQGRVAIGAGQSGGTSSYVQGEFGGAENVTLTTGQMPIHTHAAQPSLSAQISATTNAATSATPIAGGVLAAANSSDGENSSPVNAYGTGGANTNLQGGPVSGSIAIGPAGGSQPFSVLQPFQVIQFIICLEGLFPPRP